jgi:unspecific monooxygenase
MQSFSQSPTDPDFVHNPYAFYDRARAAGPFFHWADYDLICTPSATAANTIFRDRRFGREIPAELATPPAPHTAGFYGIEAHSMLELEPPRHTRLRGLVLRAFTSRRIAALYGDIASLSHQLIDALPDAEFDLISGFAQPLPVIIIARLLGMPESMAGDLLRWSNAMVGMYQARRSLAMEQAANDAALAFSDFLRGYIDQRRAAPADDLITHLIAAEAEGERLSTDEMIATCILLLNAGHEATVHTLGNGVKTLLETQSQHCLGPDHIAATVEEILRFDPALHMFTRHAYETVEVMGHTFRRGDKVGLLLGATNRDPHVWDRASQFLPDRQAQAHLSFGAGLHFCVGAPLARLELQVALPILFDRLPHLRLAQPARYADLYHFHGLEALLLAR